MKRTLRRALAAFAASMLIIVAAAGPAAAEPPQAFDQSGSVAVNAPLPITLDAVDGDADPLTFTVVSSPSHGVLDDCSTGTCTYTPATDYVGPDSFTWKANDGTTDSNTATFSISVDPLPVPPVVNLQAAASGATSILLTWTNPPGIDGIVVRYSTVVFPPTTADGTGVPVVGTPESVDVGGLTTGTTYYFSVFAMQGQTASEPAHAEFTPFACPDLTPALDGGSLVTGQGWVACSGANAHEAASTLNTVLPKTGATQALMTSGDKAVAVPPDEGPSEGTSNGSGSRGAFDVSIYRIDVNVPDGQTCLRFDYVFASEEYPEFVGTQFNDGFLAQLDQHQWAVEGSTITATDNFARFADNSYISVNSTVFSASATVYLPDTNGTGYDGMSVPLTASTPITAGPHSIYLSIFDAGDPIYDSAVFLDRLRTGTGSCTAGTNQPPNAVDDSATTSEDTPVQVSVLANDTDPDADPLSMTGHGNPSHGTVSCSTTTCTYTPATNFTGADSFTYTISDGRGGNDTATVNVTVTAANDPPAAADDSATTSQNTPVQVSVLANDTDPDADPLSVTGHGDPSHGTVSCSTTTCTYTPTSGYTGPDSFTYTISDGHGGTDTATVSVTVNPVATADVSILKTALDTTVSVGGVAGYRLQVRNVSASPSGQVTLTDVLPAGYKPKIVLTSTACTYSGGTLTCTWASLPAGSIRLIEITGAFVTRGSKSNTATIDAVGDPNPANNSSSATITVSGKSCTIVGTFGNDTNLVGTAGSDVICGLAGDDRILAMQGNDTVYGNGGNDRLNGFGGNDLLNGGPGRDTILYDGLLQGVSVNLANHYAVGQGADSLVLVENVVGSNLNDRITGNGGPNTLNGLGGNDQVNGGAGADSLNGGAGNDTLNGGAGNDSLNGGPGNDTCSQGTGAGPMLSC